MPYDEAKQRTWLSQAFKVGAALGLAGAWVTLGYGLFGTAVDREYAEELEAGGRFGVNFALYWPYYLLTLPVLGVAVLGLLRRPTTLVLIAVALAVDVLFATWILTVNENAYRIGLVEVALWAQLIHLLALGCLCLAWIVQPPE